MSFAPIILFALAIAAAVLLPVAGVWIAVHMVRAVTFLLGAVFGAVGFVFQHAGRFVGGLVTDTVQVIGHLVSLAFALPMVLASACLLRFGAARHYGLAAEDAFYGALISAYRVLVGHPARLVGLGALTERFEVTTPRLFAEAPRTEVAAPAAAPRPLPTPPAGTFPGYEVEEELRAGGSGARLFLARPTSGKAEELRRRGMDAPARVVIKAFDRRFGSTVPQIVRESRALEAARGLGLVLEHVTEDEAFHYVMPHVPGHDLDVETRRLHERSGPEGLGRNELALVLGYTRDLCQHLARFHAGGLWHKDVKPSNLLVAEGRLRVVDFGLVTPLESALTLTTHGTEYFRDPELVRLALAGKRVQDVDGVKFDLFSAGAVLYSMLENSFPAHGSLSSISKRAPEGLRWIVRRAMADVDKRYASAQEMLADVRALLAAEDPFALPLSMLPSVSGEGAAALPPEFGADASGPQGMGAAGARSGSIGADRTAGPGDDVKRFSAFGLTAELSGLGRFEERLGDARRRLSERRAVARDRREAEQAARREARAQARDERRSRRRSALRGFATLGCMALIVTSLWALRPSAIDGGHGEGRSEAWVHDQVAGPWDAEAPPAWIAGPFLVLTDHDDPALAAQALRIVESNRRVGIGVVGADLEDPDELHLVSTARYRLDSAGPSVRAREAALRRLIAERPELQGIQWVRDDEVRTLYADERRNPVRLEVTPFPGIVEVPDAPR